MDWHRRTSPTSMVWLNQLSHIRRQQTDSGPYKTRIVANAYRRNMDPTDSDPLLVVTL